MNSKFLLGEENESKDILKTFRNIEIVVLFIILVSVYSFVLIKLRMKIELPGLICMGLYLAITFLRTVLYLLDLKEDVIEII